MALCNSRTYGTQICGVVFIGRGLEACDEERAMAVMLNKVYGRLDRQTYFCGCGRDGVGRRTYIGREL
jgi:hypothetical protein